MTRTSDTFGGIALAILTVFALWSSTLAMPHAPAPLTPAVTMSAPTGA
jgi:hypothetical protein